MINKSTQIITFSDREYVNNSTQIIKKVIQDLTKNSNKINIAVSGGNSPLPIYKKLATTNLDWNKINFFLVDERCVPNTDKQSNFGNLKHFFFKHISSNNFPVVKEGLTLNEMAIEYENQIRQHVKKANGVPQFDLVILGMGLDGHTASLFPETKALKDYKNLIVVNSIPQLKTKRITMTFPLLLNSKKIVLIAKGEKKKKILNNIHEKHPISKIIPQIYRVLN